MRANFFGDFEYYAYINGTLHQLECDRQFSRAVKLYKNSVCMLGNDFVHVGIDPNIQPCIKMDFTAGSHAIKLITHHTRPFRGVSCVAVRDDNYNVIFENSLMPGEISKWDIRMNKSTDFNLYLTFTSTEVRHGLLRVMLMTEPTQHDADIQIDVKKSKWLVRDLETTVNQTVENIVYDTEYKY